MTDEKKIADKPESEPPPPAPVAETAAESKKEPASDASDLPEDAAADDPDAAAADGALSGAETPADETPAKAAKTEGPKTEIVEKEKARGNPLRMQALGVTAVGAVGAFLLMAHNGRVVLGIPIGFLFVAVAAFGLLDFLGYFDDRAEPKPTEPGPATAYRAELPPQLAADEEVVSLASLAVPIGRTVAAVVAFLGLLAAAGSGLGPPWIMGLLITASFLGGVAGIYDVGVRLGPFATDENGQARALYERHGFWVVVIGALLYLPGMGVFSLWDPWETHYGEVAREILARDDWISLWWAQDGWFWSKPILNFWVQSLSMGSLGTHFQPDQMMSGLGGAGAAHPEWIVRMPNVMLTLTAMYFLYKGVARAFGRRAGLFGGVVLASSPDWYFLAHQTMADMPFVAPMTTAMGLLLMGLNTDPDAKGKTFVLAVGERKLRLSLVHLVTFVIAVCAIPQVLYLLSRNVELALHGTPKRIINFHLDEFQSGSAINCGLPGNEPCRQTFPAASPRNASAIVKFFGGFEPFLQGVVWAAALGALLHFNRGERRKQRLYYLAAWFFAALATMGKGPVGIVIPIATIGVYLVATRLLSAKRFFDARSFFEEVGRVEVWSGFLVIACVAAPWFVAMYIRHGAPFTDRLFIHDMFNRAVNHVHDTNEGDDTSFRFYIWQLGYALFPWTGLAPLGLTFWAWKRSRKLREGAVFLTAWFILAFFLFSFMGTKFHHYIFPAVPPMAMLIGVVLDQMYGRAEERESLRDAATAFFVAFLAAALLAFGASKHFPGQFLGGRVSATELAPARPWLGRGLMAAGLLLFGGLVYRRRGHREETNHADASAQSSRAHENILTGAGVIAGLFVAVLVGRDLATKGDSPDQPGAIRLLQLFTYNYRRPWPVEDIDFQAALGGLAVASVIITFMLALPQIRRHVVLLALGLGLLGGAWGTDVYMVKTAPHWGQREVIEAYYRNRQGPNEQLVAYQMNWKGENFYAGNRIPAFVSSGANFTTWLKQQREKGQTVMYFITEHSRTGGLKSEVGGRSYKEITDRKLCNKFVLVRAEL